MIELWQIASVKCNLTILLSTEQFRLSYAQKKGLTEKEETHKRHKTYLTEVYEVFTNLSKENTALQTRNMELNYSNAKLLHEIDKLKEQNKHLQDGL